MSKLNKIVYYVAMTILLATFAYLCVGGLAVKLYYIYKEYYGVN